MIFYYLIIFSYFFKQVHLLFPVWIKIKFKNNSENLIIYGTRHGVKLVTFWIIYAIFVEKEK